MSTTELYPIPIIDVIVYRPFFVNIVGKSIKALFDTGSTASFISHSLWEELELRKETKVYKEIYNPLLGKINGEFEIGTIRIRIGLSLIHI